MERPFRRFARFTAPNPVPTRWQFYREGFKDNFWNSMALGEARYRQNLLYNKRERRKMLLISLAYAVTFALFRRLRRTFANLFMLALLTGPIMSANRTFPKLALAYEQVQQGNPTKGRNTFRVALDDSVYSIMQDFMKPLTIGMAGGILLNIPVVLRGEGMGVIDRMIRCGGRVLGIKAQQAPMRWLYRVTAPAIHWGDGLCNRLRNKLPILNWLEQ